MEVRGKGKGEVRRILARNYCQQAGDGGSSERDEGKGGNRRCGGHRDNDLQCKQAYKLLFLSGSNLGDEHIVKENASNQTGCGKISLSFTPDLFLFFFALF